MQQSIEKKNALTSFRQWWRRMGEKAEAWSKKGGPVRRKMYLNRTLYLMMLPYLILFVTFTVIPVLMSLALSFTSYNILEAPKFIGWTNYLTLFLDDEIFIIAIKNTLILAVITGPIGYVAAFVIAWLINELPGKLRSIVTLAFYAPSLSANALVIWTLIFSSDIYGYANAFLLEWGFITEPQTWLTNTTYILPIVIVVQLWMSLGVGFLSLVAGLKSVNKELYEAGALDGIRNRWQELWYITLPSMKPQLIFSAVMQISGTLGIGGITTALAGFPSVSYAAHTIVNHLSDYGGIRYEMGYASAIATLLFLASIGLNKLIRRMIRRVGN
ncbi:MAG: sugar ABC transporter permease [Bacilli bacterium]|nr:sugar ABC transporter permease [Bacilli bacterium]